MANTRYALRIDLQVRGFHLRDESWRCRVQGRLVDQGKQNTRVAVMCSQ